MTEAEELLARMGASTCVFCGRLSRQTSLTQNVIRSRDHVYGIPCSEKCGYEIYRDNEHWHQEYQARLRRDSEAALAIQRSQLRALHEHDIRSYANNFIFLPVP